MTEFSLGVAADHLEHGCLGKPPAHLLVVGLAENSWEKEAVVGHESALKSSVLRHPHNVFSCRHEGTSKALMDIHDEVLEVASKLLTAGPVGFVGKVDTLCGAQDEASAGRFLWTSVHEVSQLFCFERRTGTLGRQEVASATAVARHFLGRNRFLDGEERHGVLRCRVRGRVDGNWSGFRIRHDEGMYCLDWVFEKGANGKGAGGSWDYLLVFSLVRSVGYFFFLFPFFGRLCCFCFTFTIALSRLGFNTSPLVPSPVSTRRPTTLTACLCDRYYHWASAEVKACRRAYQFPLQKRTKRRTDVETVCNP